MLRHLDRGLQLRPLGRAQRRTGVRFRYTGQQLLGQLNPYHYKARTPAGGFRNATPSERTV